MNIVVLAGGLSTEREVSLSSGSMVARSLADTGHNALLVDAFFGKDEDVSGGIEEYFLNCKDTEIVKVSKNEPDISKIRNSRPDSGYGTLGKNVIELCRAADIVYMGLHGENGENGKMQAFFDVLEIKYTGSGYLGSALAMNKELAKDILRPHGVTMPRGKVLYRGKDEEPGKDISVPCIVKPCCGGSSIGLTVAKTEQELKTAVKTAFEYEDKILVEEFVQGREFSVGVLGDTVLPPIEIRPKGGVYDYEHKYQSGWTEEICPADITENECKSMQYAAKKVFDVLGLEVYARIDFIMNEKGESFFLEAKNIPGMTPTSLLPQEAAAIGISYDELVNKIISLSLEKYGK